MKILYISHEYGDRRLKYADVLNSLGNEVKLIRISEKSKPGQVDIEAFDKSFDVIWLFSADYIRFKVITDAFLAAVSENGTLLVGSVIIAVNTPFDTWVEPCRQFDIWFTSSQMVADMARRKGLTNVHKEFFGFNPSDYYKLQRRIKWNVTFIGSPQTFVEPEIDLRCSLLNSLKSFGIRVFGGKEMRRRLDKSIKVTPFSTHKQQNEVYNRSRINLDIPYINSKLPEYQGKYYPKNRLLEVPGSGNFLMEAHCDEFNEVLQKDVHCGYYTPETIGDVLEYYLSHENETHEISREGYEHVVRNYTNQECFSRMVKKICLIREEKGSS